ncbi:MAG: site-2 protease family protein [Candidatus Pacebacteria bacterium]|nr:site-2 protease family protein [Candidatus Paceibacterota bacterium]
MSILIFILVLVVLIVVHELGHFFAAKWAGMRVDEFGIGYPPRALTVAKKGDTEYTLNWLPFGGFVKIYGEDESEEGGAAARSFVSKPRIVQALVLIAGIAMNLVFAWVLLSITLGLGVPRALTSEEALNAPDAAIMIASVLPGSPAEVAGIKAGDAIVSAAVGEEVFSTPDPAAFTAFIAKDTTGEEITLTIERNGEETTVNAIPRQGVAASDPSRFALGVGVGVVGTVAVSPLEAPIEGARITWEVTKQTAVGLWHFFGSIFTLSADLSQVSGPVGIAGAVGTAAGNGFASLLSLTAIISVNLALINLLPVPALDGGRLLFVIIESIIRRPIPKGVAAAVNTAGFAFLLLLMFAITASDLFKLFTT